MITQFASFRVTTQLKFATAPYVRQLTASGVPIEVIDVVREATEARHALKNKEWYLQNSETRALLSPWHDVEFEASTGSQNHVTGVIEVTRNTNKKLRLQTETLHNPISQEVAFDTATNEPCLATYKNAPKFNLGFVPRTWCHNGSDAFDLVDLSQKQLKPILAISDYLVLGAFTQASPNHISHKMFAIEVNEARERGIRTQADYSRQCPGAIAEVMAWFKETEGAAQTGHLLKSEEALELINSSHTQYQNTIVTPGATAQFSQEPVVAKSI